MTDPGDLVVDFFAGSNTSGAVAERLGRRWMTNELDRTYVAASAFRFLDDPGDGPDVYQRILAGRSVTFGEPVAVEIQGQPAPVVGGA